ncbi:MAG TPA: winged helix-turn-helix transcriptional regulator, partial [Burkholderiales bacterium]
WSMLLIYAGLRGVARFNEMQAELKLSSHLLSLRLKELVGLGIFERVRYSQSPPRFEYRLTAKGLDMYKLGVFAMYWGDRWLTPGRPPTLVQHRACAARLQPDLRCNACRQSLRRTACHFEPALFTRPETTMEVQ